MDSLTAPGDKRPIAVALIFNATALIGTLGLYFWLSNGSRFPQSLKIMLNMLLANAGFQLLVLTIEICRNIVGGYTWIDYTIFILINLGEITFNFLVTICDYTLLETFSVLNEDLLSKSRLVTIKRIVIGIFLVAGAPLGVVVLFPTLTYDIEVGFIPSVLFFFWLCLGWSILCIIFDFTVNISLVNMIYSKSKKQANLKGTFRKMLLLLFATVFLDCLGIATLLYCFNKSNIWLSTAILGIQGFHIIALLSTISGLKDLFFKSMHENEGNNAVALTDVEQPWLKREGPLAAGTLDGYLFKENSTTGLVNTLETPIQFDQIVAIPSSTNSTLDGAVGRSNNS